MIWHGTGDVAPGALTSSRIQLHYAAYVLASVAHSVLESSDDDSHTNLGVETDFASLSTRALVDSVQLHLDFASYELVLRRDAESLASLALEGATVDSSLRWAEGVLATCGASAKIERRVYPDFPASSLSDGASFERPKSRELEEHWRWFANANALFAELHAGEAQMLHARVWPHHFDLGSLISLGADASIGLGYSPGDEHFDMPYFYCSPYPQPDASSALPELEVGSWNREGFVSAILTGAEVQGDGALQHDVAQRYLKSAVACCRGVLREA